MSFDASIGKLKCEYCNSEISAEELGMFSISDSKDVVDLEEKKDRNWDFEKSSFKSYACSSCGAELLADAVTTVMRCPFCGDHVIAASQISGSLRPDYIIPFSVTKEQVVEEYKKYYSGFIIPEKFRKSGEIKEIQGVYVPFWFYSGKAVVDAAFLGKRDSNKKVKKIVLQEVNGKMQTVNKKVLEEKGKYYEVNRHKEKKFSKLPVDASKRMQDDLMDCIEPYNYEELKEFSPAYLPGFMAERFDVDKKVDMERAGNRIKGTISEEIEKEILSNGYDKCKKSKIDLKVEDESVEYAFLPVWMLTVKWKKKNWTFAMNGQTGQMTGNLPISPIRLTIFTIILYAIMAILAHIIYYICSWEPISHGESIALFVSAAVITWIVIKIMWEITKPVKIADNADHYMENDIAE
ncbi:MAG: hypothetical protein K5894_12005 [Lachnospiraceae bacterium]|nr:hypothetical protein [Lachnospiraceae bacterium]